MAQCGRNSARTEPHFNSPNLESQTGVRCTAVGCYLGWCSLITAFEPDLERGNNAMPRSVLNPVTDTTQPRWSLRIAASALSRRPVAASQWHYKDGLLYKGILHLWQQTGDARYWDSLKSYVDRFVTPDGQIATYSLDEY